jgi:AraC-like DNA-binding protein
MPSWAYWATMDRPQIAVDVHESGPYSWTMAHRQPHASLIDHVVGYTGYVERSVLPLRRREVANDNVVVIISFGEPIDVRFSTSPASERYTSFVAGLHDGFVITEHGGRQAGVEIRLTPLGALRLLGLPPSELAHRVVEIDALDGRALTQLAERLAVAPDWPERFGLIDAELLRRAAEGPQADPAVRWAWRQLADAHGQVAVGVLAEEIGWSRRHFVARFHQQVGLAPKQAARVLRFNRAVHLLTAGDPTTVSAVAAACGYTDHSHLVREFHDMAGCTPTALVGARLPDGGGIAG